MAERAQKKAACSSCNQSLGEFGRRASPSRSGATNLSASRAGRGGRPAQPAASSKEPIPSQAGERAVATGSGTSGPSVAGSSSGGEESPSGGTPSGEALDVPPPSTRKRKSRAKPSGLLPLGRSRPRKEQPEPAGDRTFGGQRREWLEDQGQAAGTNHSLLATRHGARFLRPPGQVACTHGAGGACTNRCQWHHARGGLSHWRGCALCDGPTRDGRCPPYSGTGSASGRAPPWAAPLLVEGGGPGDDDSHMSSLIAKYSQPPPACEPLWSPLCSSGEWAHHPLATCRREHHCCSVPSSAYFWAPPWSGCQWDEPMAGQQQHPVPASLSASGRRCGGASIASCSPWGDCNYGRSGAGAKFSGRVRTTPLEITPHFGHDHLRVDSSSYGFQRFNASELDFCATSCHIADFRASLDRELEQTSPPWAHMEASAEKATAPQPRTVDSGTARQASYLQLECGSNYWTPTKGSIASTADACWSLQNEGEPPLLHLATPDLSPLPSFGGGPADWLVQDVSGGKQWESGT